MIFNIWKHSLVYSYTNYYFILSFHPVFMVKILTDSNNFCILSFCTYAIISIPIIKFVIISNLIFLLTIFKLLFLTVYITVLLIYVHKDLYKNILMDVACWIIPNPFHTPCLRGRKIKKCYFKDSSAAGALEALTDLPFMVVTAPIVGNIMTQFLYLWNKALGVAILTADLPVG